jgi:hypothetical protein
MLLSRAIALSWLFSSAFESELLGLVVHAVAVISAAAVAAVLAAMDSYFFMVSLR